ncbi:hypothetical protein [Kutzneria sp. NPDC052558]
MADRLGYLLRREEVAVLSGMSADYRTRSEQGRELTSWAQVVSPPAMATA